MAIPTAAGIAAATAIGKYSYDAYKDAGSGTNWNYNHLINSLVANETKMSLHVIVTDSDHNESHRTLDPMTGFKAQCRNKGNFTAKAYREVTDGKGSERPLAACSDKAGYFAVFQTKGGKIGVRTGRYIIWDMYTTQKSN